MVPIIQPDGRMIVSLRNSLLRVTAGALAVAIMSFPALARDDKDTRTEFSAQAKSGPNTGKKAAPRNVAPAQRNGPRPAPTQRAAPPPAPIQRVAPAGVAPTHVAPDHTAPVTPQVYERQAVPRISGGQRNIVVPRNVGPGDVAPVTGAPMTAAPRIITRGAPGQANRAFTPAATGRTSSAPPAFATCRRAASDEHRSKAGIILYGAVTIACGTAAAGALSLRSARRAPSQSARLSITPTLTSRRRSPIATAAPKTVVSLSGKTSRRWKAEPTPSASPIAPGNKGGANLR